MLVPSQSDTYYNLALAYNKISESRMADLYYNRYQDMLSLRKAQERLEEVRKEQEREKRISESEAKKAVLKNNTAVSAKKPPQDKKSKKGTLSKNLMASKINEKNEINFNVFETKNHQIICDELDKNIKRNWLPSNDKSICWRWWRDGFAPETVGPTSCATQKIRN